MVCAHSTTVISRFPFRNGHVSVHQWAFWWKFVFPIYATCCQSQIYHHCPRCLRHLLMTNSYLPVCEQRWYICFSTVICLSIDLMISQMGMCLLMNGAIPHGNQKIYFIELKWVCACWWTGTYQCVNRYKLFQEYTHWRIVQGPYAIAETVWI